MPYNCQPWWEMYPAVFLFASFITFVHRIFPSLVICCILLSDQNVPREPKFHCLQQTKGDPARSRCFQVAYLLKMIFFGCPPTGDKRTRQCKVQEAFIDLNLEFCWTLTSRLYPLKLCPKVASGAFDPKSILSKYDFSILRLHRRSFIDATRRYKDSPRFRFLCLGML
jgi:hypothetical protein